MTPIDCLKCGATRINGTLFTLVSKNLLLCCYQMAVLVKSMFWVFCLFFLLTHCGTTGILLLSFFSNLLWAWVFEHPKIQLEWHIMHKWYILNWLNTYLIQMIHSSPTYAIAKSIISWLREFHVQSKINLSVCLSVYPSSYLFVLQSSSQPYEGM